MGLERKPLRFNDAALEARIAASDIDSRHIEALCLQVTRIVSCDRQLSDGRPVTVSPSYLYSRKLYTVRRAVLEVEHLHDYQHRSRNEGGATVCLIYPQCLYLLSSPSLKLALTT